MSLFEWYFGPVFNPPCDSNKWRATGPIDNRGVPTTERGFRELGEDARYAAEQERQRRAAVSSEQEKTP